MNRHLMAMMIRKVKNGENPHEKMLNAISHRRDGNANCREMLLQVYPLAGLSSRAWVLILPRLPGNRISCTPSITTFVLHGCCRILMCATAWQRGALGSSQTEVSVCMSLEKWYSHSPHDRCESNRPSSTGGKGPQK